MVDVYDVGELDLDEEEEDDLIEALAPQPLVPYPLALWCLTVTPKTKRKRVTPILLTGPYSQFDVFKDMLINRYNLEPMEVMDVSGWIGLLVAFDVDKFQFFKLKRSDRAYIFKMFEFSNLTQINLTPY